MSSDQNRTTPLGLRISAIAGLLFLHLPLALIFLYAFTTEERSFQFPPPGYTAKWFAVAWFDRPDIWPPLYLSLRVAAIATFLALILGTLAAAFTVVPMVIMGIYLYVAKRMGAFDVL